MNNASSTKPAGSWDVRRKIRVPGLGQETDAMDAVQTLEALPSVKKVVANIQKRHLVVRYDASETDFMSIISVLKNCGFPPSTSWWSNIKGKWYQFTDSNARENAHLPSPPCCNKPPR